MKIQHLMALVVLSFPTVPGARAAVQGFKARTLVPGLLILTCVLVAAPATAELTYGAVSGHAFVSGNPDASGDIVIASTYLGYPVTFIASSAFLNCSNLTSVTFPNSLTGIGPQAFSGCTRLTNVILGNGVTSIGQQAFYNCTSLTSVTLPNSVTSIGRQAFSGSSLTSVTLPNSFTGIGQQAFSGCTSLTNATIPNSVTSIGQEAFGGCTSLASVILPNSVTSISYGAFGACTSLTSVTIPNSVTFIGYSAFLGSTSLTNLSADAANPAYSSLNGVLFNKAQTTLLIFPPGRVSYVMPDSVTSIGPQAFYTCTSLTNLTIGNGVTNIGTAAFVFCTNLTSVIFGNSVANIGFSAFVGCTSLMSVTIPASVTRIGSQGFHSCTSLTNFTFLGNAPQLLFDFDAGFAQFQNVGAGAKAYYYCGTTGWGTSYGSLPTVMLCPPQIAPGSAGLKPGGFGFTLTYLTNQTVVEASANLVNWQPIWTNTLPGASADFVDPEWVNHPRRFYRARSD